MFEGLWKSCSEVNDVATCVDWIDAGAPGKDSIVRSNRSMRLL
jgi:hypothetical protein